MIVWQDSIGNALSLARPATYEFANLADVDGLRKACRKVAQRVSSGLVQAEVVAGVDGPAVQFIYKRLDGRGFVVTGVMVVTPDSKSSPVWTVVSPERGTTGVREAIVTEELIKAGTMTVDSYASTWAQDPYEPAYSGVDRGTLRYVSDDEAYDSRFPHHPLSRVRRTLRALTTIPLKPAQAP